MENFLGKFHWRCCIRHLDFSVIGAAASWSTNIGCCRLHIASTSNKRDPWRLFNVIKFALSFWDPATFSTCHCQHYGQQYSAKIIVTPNRAMNVEFPSRKSSHIVDIRTSIMILVRPFQLVSKSITDNRLQPLISVLLKLSGTINLGKFINKICLPLQNQFTYFFDDNIRNNLIQDRTFVQKT